MPLLALSLAVLLGLQASAAQSGAAAVTGRVLDAETQQPIAGAQVSVMLEGRPPTGPIAPSTAETDASGIYRFANLAPGRYRIMVRRVGYAVPGLPTSRHSSRSPQARRRPRRTSCWGAAASSRAACWIRRANRWSTPGHGDKKNEPGRGQAPSLMPMGSGAQTNDLGEFRLHSLPAGEYFVQLVPRMEPGFMAASPTPREHGSRRHLLPGHRGCGKRARHHARSRANGGRHRLQRSHGPRLPDHRSRGRRDRRTGAGCDGDPDVGSGRRHPLLRTGTEGAR